jgi:hypothetical protein
MNPPKPSATEANVPGVLPDELQLQLAPGESVQFAVPAAENFEIQWNLTVVGSGSRSLAGGSAEVITFAVPPTAGPHTLIRGQILIVRSEDGARVRSVPVAGWVRKPPAQVETPAQHWRLPPSWWKWAAGVLGVIAAMAGLSLLSPRQQLIVKPARVNFGTLWYSPPSGGSVETSLVFTVQWRGRPREAADLQLFAHAQYQCSGDKIAQCTLEETTNFPVAAGSSEAAIPLGSGVRSGDNVHISGIISLSVSNSSTPIPVSPDHIEFNADFRPAP